MHDVAIIGVGLHPFGRFEGKTAMQMGIDAITAAVTVCTSDENAGDWWLPCTPASRCGSRPLPASTNW